MALKNIRRRPFRTLAMILYFGLVTSTLFGATLLIRGATNSVERGASRLGADIMVVPAEAGPLCEEHLLTGSVVSFYFHESIASQVASIPGVDYICKQLFIATLSDAPCCAAPVTLIGIDQETDFTIKPWLTTHLMRDLGADEAIIGSRIIGNIGGEVMFYGHTYTVAGILETTGTGIDTSVYIPMETAYIMAEETPTKAIVTLDIPRDTISAVLVKTNSNANVEVVSNQIKAQVPDVAAITSSLMLGKISEQLSSVVQGLYTTSVAVTLVMLPMIAVITSMVANERRKEFGLLRALGSTKQFIFSIVTLETVLIATIGGLLGAISTGIVLYSFTAMIMKVFGIPYLWLGLLDTMTVATTFVGVAVVVGVIAALYPAINISRIDPYSAMRREA
jgi:putative ABC transport system permease protein